MAPISPSPVSGPLQSFLHLEAADGPILMAAAFLALIVAGGPIYPSRGGPSLISARALHPWVAFGVLPVFAFANAGVPLGGLAVGDVLEPVPLGIAAGLLLGSRSGS